MNRFLSILNIADKTRSDIGKLRQLNLCRALSLAFAPDELRHFMHVSNFHSQILFTHMKT